MNFFYSTLIDPIFDVESIGDGPRVPRAHLEVVFTTTQRTFLPADVRVFHARRPFTPDSLSRQTALPKPSPKRVCLEALEPPSAHSGRSCPRQRPYPQLPPRRRAGKSIVLRGEPDLESERAMLNSLDFPTESNLFRQRATLGCAHLMPQHLQHACTPPFKCLSLTGQRLNLNSPPPKADAPDAQAGPAGLGAGLRRSGRGCSKISR